MVSIRSLLLFTLLFFTPFATFAAIFCDAGEYFNGMSCTSCNPGTANLSTASGGVITGCVLCNVGTFAASFGQETCDLCPAGTYAPSVESTSCISCPTGSSSEAGASVCRSNAGRQSSINSSTLFYPKKESQEQTPQDTETLNDEHAGDTKEHIETKEDIAITHTVTIIQQRIERFGGDKELLRIKLRNKISSLVEQYLQAGQTKKAMLLEMLKEYLEK